MVLVFTLLQLVCCLMRDRAVFCELVMLLLVLSRSLCQRAGMFEDAFAGCFCSESKSAESRNLSSVSFVPLEPKSYCAGFST